MPPLRPTTILRPEAGALTCPRTVVTYGLKSDGVLREDRTEYRFVGGSCVGTTMSSGRAVLENKAGLLTPGVFGRLQLYGGDIDAMLIPDSAVISDQARKIVFTVGNDNVVKARPVELGGIVEGLRVVRAGLSLQDKVVIDGLANPMVRPGATIVPQPAEIKAASN